jgi:hypothetical protein
MGVTATTAKAGPIARRKTGSRMVPRPKPVRNVKAEATAAPKLMRISSGMAILSVATAWRLS